MYRVSQEIQVRMRMHVDETGCQAAAMGVYLASMKGFKVRTDGPYDAVRHEHVGNVRCGIFLAAYNSRRDEQDIGGSFRRDMDHLESSGGTQTRSRSKIPANDCVPERSDGYMSDTYPDSYIVGDAHRLIDSRR